MIISLSIIYQTGEKERKEEKHLHSLPPASVQVNLFPLFPYSLPPEEKEKKNFCASSNHICISVSSFPRAADSSPCLSQPSPQDTSSFSSFDTIERRRRRKRSYFFSLLPFPSSSSSSSTRSTVGCAAFGFERCVTLLLLFSTRLSDPTSDLTACYCCWCDCRIKRIILTRVRLFHFHF